jgi:hypothetical protein
MVNFYARWIDWNCILGSELDFFMRLEDRVRAEKNKSIRGEFKRRLLY